jgi:PAS domain S-box-containing protein
MAEKQIPEKFEQRTNELKEETASVVRDISEYKQAERELKRRKHGLEKRVKELNCLYDLSRLDQERNIPLEELFQSSIELIPLAWQYPEITCARINLEGREFRTKNFKETIWKQACEIKAFGEGIGNLEVFYLRKRPNADEGPFLEEERSLINFLAQGLGRKAERKWTEKALKTSHAFLEAANMHTEMKPLLREFISQVKDLTGCEAAGIQILNEEGTLLYEDYDGLDPRFYESENFLPENSNRGICNNVIRGTTDLNPPFYTAGGSFYTNRANGFLDAVSEKERGQSLNLAGARPYESIAHVPIRTGDKTLGLIQVADRQENMLPLGVVELLEGVAMQLETAIQRVRAEEALRESEDRYRDLYENAPVAYFSISAVDGSIIRCNTSALKLLGYDKKTLLEMKVLDLYDDTPDGISKAQKVFKDFRAGESIKDIELQVKHKDGYPIWINLSVEPVRDRYGKVVESRSIAIDITARKRAEEDIKKGTENIKVFAYSVAHDLKNPTIGLHGLTKLLSNHAMDVFDEKGKRYCDQILKASEQIAALVENINIYVSTKETPLNIEKIDVKEILRMIREEFSTQLNNREIKWTEDEKILEINADKLSILRILRNLIDNTLKYGGDILQEIKIGYRESHEFHILSVMDDGIGIKKEDSEKIFGVFQRKETHREIQGTGLGLAIVRELVERHGGRVWVEPGRERGVTFYIPISKYL